MLKVFMLLFTMMCGFIYFSSLEIVVILLVIFLLFTMIVDWESMWMSYVLEMFSMDMMSIGLILLSLWISVLMLLAAFNLPMINEKSFFFYLLLMTFLLVMCFSLSNLFMFFIFFESVLFPIIMMVLNWGVQPERLQAGIYMLFYTLFGSFPLFVYLLTSNFSVNFIYLFMKSDTVWSIFFLLIVMAFIVSVPMFLVHLWLPSAHVEAPIVGSMILAGVLLKLGIYGLYRFKPFIIMISFDWNSVMLSISILGGLIISLVCLTQVDLKSLIAYSSICHMGMALGGVFSFNIWGGNGALIMMIGHGLCSSALFCLANFMYERFFTRSLMLLSGLGVIFPFLSLWWFLFCVVNMGAPPSMNFFAEIMLLGSMLKYSFFLVMPLFFLSFFSACYSLYMFSYTQHGKGWVFFGISMISTREYLLMFLHFFPLVVWVFKMELFMNWF
uniref:NADH-ubiquinone oxidoreductase chain 4 n=1 Tax=Argas lagenoplastis TaxID=182350 RepID=W0FDC1_ARGLA|nr:NADH dehydrogenase subunit 4 [Argas lagenoplastis]AHF21608.1 NADH dehydrogenase subunit 4 [Argas lagenoplastis]